MTVLRTHVSADSPEFGRNEAAHRELLAFEGGWDAKLVSHFTPGGDFIHVGSVVGNGFGEPLAEARIFIVQAAHLGIHIIQPFNQGAG